jgi:serine-type D-Ala-D-Ala carboxypeptidase (penicillin-binding protein 5/6)
MKQLIFFLTVVLGAACIPAAAQVMPQPPEIAARSYLLLDVTANQILAAKDIDAPVEPASLTKLMTAYLVFDALRSGKIELTQTLSVSERAWRQPGSRMFIDPKMKVAVEDLIKGLIVQSGNDAAMVLAEGVGGSTERFVQLMNEQARALGMTSTTYKNPTGLSAAGHVTSARDLSILATGLMRDFPDYVHYYAIKKYHLEGTPPANDNNRNLLLLRDPSVDGLKTGHTAAAGFCLIASAKRDFPNLGAPGALPGTPAASGPRRLLVIVLGTASENARANEAQKLLNWGYTAYEAVKLFEANQAVVSPAVWKGKSATALLGRQHAIVVAVPAGSAARIATQVIRPDPLVAPLRKGQSVGQLKISLGGRSLIDLPLLVLDSVEEAGLIGRAWDALRLWLR